MPENENKNRGGSSGEEESKQAASEDSDLKEREYRDEEGNIHHHTRTSREYREGESEKKE